MPTKPNQPTSPTPEQEEGGIGRQPQGKGASDQLEQIAHKPVNTGGDVPEMRTGATSPPRDEQDMIERTAAGRRAKNMPSNPDAEAEQPGDQPDADQDATDHDRRGGSQEQ
jgi:hypothetical protein